MSAEVTQNVQKKWLIFVLIYADFTDKEDGIEGDVKKGLDSMFEDFITTSLNPDLCRLFIAMDSISYFKEDDQIFLRNLVVTYELGNSDASSSNEIINCTVFHNGTEKVGVNQTFQFNRHAFQKSDSLSKILCSVQPGEDEEILFITWDHGSGFGIFRDQSTQNENRKDNYLFSPDDYPFINLFWNRAIKGQAKNDLPKPADDSQNNGQVPELLSVSELATAFSIWLIHEKKIGVLLMMNCWMMNIHTLYSMKERVTCLVATQGDMSNPGYNYASILAAIGKQIDISMTPQNLAIHCRTSCYAPELADKAKKMGLCPEQTIMKWIVIPIDLQVKDDTCTKIIDKQFDALKKLTIALLDSIKNNDANNSVKHILRFIRPLSLDFTHDLVQMIDVYNFFDCLIQVHNSFLQGSGEILSEQIKNAINELLDYKISPAKLILDYKLNTIYFENSDVNYILPKPTGYSIFFRHWPAARFDEKVNYNVANDLMLNNFLPQWRDMLYALYDV